MKRQRIPVDDLNLISQHRFYRRLPASPKNMLNVLIAIARDHNSRTFSVSMKELSFRCGYTTANVRTTLKRNRELLEALGFLKFRKGKSLGAHGTTAGTYTLVDDWQNLSDSEYQRIIDDLANQRKERKRKREETKQERLMEIYENSKRDGISPSPQQQQRPMSAQDAIDKIRSDPKFNRIAPDWR